MICIIKKNYAIEKECQLHSLPCSTTLPLWIFHNQSGNLPNITVSWTALLDCRMEIKISHQKIIDIKEVLNSQIMPRQVHSWCPLAMPKKMSFISKWSCCSQLLIGTGFSYILPACGWVRVWVCTVTTNTSRLTTVGYVGWMTDWPLLDNWTSYNELCYITLKTRALCRTKLLPVTHVLVDC